MFPGNVRCHKYGGGNLSTVPGFPVFLSERLIDTLQKSHSHGPGIIPHIRCKWRCRRRAAHPLRWHAIEKAAPQAPRPPVQKAAPQAPRPPVQKAAPQTPRPPVQKAAPQAPRPPVQELLGKKLSENETPAGVKAERGDNPPEDDEKREGPAVFIMGR